MFNVLFYLVKKEKRKKKKNFNIIANTMTIKRIKERKQVGNTEATRVPPHLTLF